MTETPAPAPDAEREAHSPGPWTAKVGHVVASNGEEIGVIWRTEAWSSGDPIEHEDQANIALICQAPSLLARAERAEADTAEIASILDRYGIACAGAHYTGQPWTLAQRVEVACLAACDESAEAELARLRAENAGLREALEREPTKLEIHNAGIKWCGEKQRETFLEDEQYFAHNWRYSPGLRKYVGREMARAALSSEQAAAGERG